MRPEKIEGQSCRVVSLSKHCNPAQVNGLKSMENRIFIAKSFQATWRLPTFASLRLSARLRPQRLSTFQASTLSWMTGLRSARPPFPTTKRPTVKAPRPLEAGTSRRPPRRSPLKRDLSFPGNQKPRMYFIFLISNLNHVQLNILSMSSSSYFGIQNCFASFQNQIFSISWFTESIRFCFVLNEIYFSQNSKIKNLATPCAFFI